MKSRAASLTPRQSEVVRLVSLGCTNEEAANILGLAVSTVDNHKAAAMRMLGTDKATLLTRIAIKNKITKLDETLTAAEKRKSGRKNDGWN
jgi:DNA-binding CsgD family transcriptional regulator